jgi:Protein of unknown function, DUF488
VLVDRLWPRGLSKERAHLDDWCKDIARSNELRKWYGHDLDRYAAVKQGLDRVRGAQVDPTLGSNALITTCALSMSVPTVGRARFRRPLRS